LKGCKAKRERRKGWSRGAVKKKRKERKGKEIEKGSREEMKSKR